MSQKFGRVMEKTMVYNSSFVTVGAGLSPGIYFISIEGFESVKIEKLR